MPEAYEPPHAKFAELGDQELVDLFDSPSHRRRLAAQRELFYRDSDRTNSYFSKPLRADLLNETYLIIAKPCHHS